MPLVPSGVIESGRPTNSTSTSRTSAFTATTFAYVIDGEGRFGAESEKATDGQMVLFARDGDDVKIENPVDANRSFEVLLIAGVPLNEPVVRYGPFVMNTRDEIHQAIEDYQLRKMGVIDA